MEIQGLMLLLLVWLSDQTELNTNVTLPKVEFVSPATIQKISGLKKVDVAAVYDEEIKTMYFKDNFDPKNIIDRGYLLHELYHHLQFENKAWYRDCTAEYERGAYHLTNIWFKNHGLPEPYSSLDIMIWSTCSEKD